jgi:hypothetical protein
LGVHHLSTRLPFVVGDGILEISQLAEASETSFLANAKVREITWFVWVSIIRQLDCLLLLEMAFSRSANSPRRLETSFLANTKVREIHWFVWVSIIRQLDCLLLIGDGILKISQLAKASETSFLAITKV